MIRVVVFLIVAGLLALGVVWLADRPGQVAITWLGYRADTSVMVAMMAVLAIAVVAVMLWGLARFFLRSPKLFSLALRERKRDDWNQPVLWPIGAGLALLILSSVPAVVSYRRRERMAGKVPA